MSNLPDHLRHAKHVGNPHAGCEVCLVKVEAAVQAVCQFVWLLLPYTLCACTNGWRYPMCPGCESTMRPEPLTVSTEGVPVVVIDEVEPFPGPYEKFVQDRDKRITAAMMRRQQG